MKRNLTRKRRNTHTSPFRLYIHALALFQFEPKKKKKKETNACTFELYSINLFDSISRFVFVMVDSDDRTHGVNR